MKYADLHLHCGGRLENASPVYQPLLDALGQVQGVAGAVGKRPYFRFENHSIPKDHPAHAGSNEELRQAIWREMLTCDAVLVLAGVYASYSDWIDEEIKIAKYDFARRKPVIAVEHWGSRRASADAKNEADVTVRWNADSIVGAIRDLT